MIVTANTTDENERYMVHGYKNREDYLSNIAHEFGIDLMSVRMIADILGPSEDFDALVNELEDFASMGAFEMLDSR